MKAELKSSVRHLFDSPDVSFSTLLTAARRNELEEIETRKRVDVILDRVEGSLGDDVVPANSYSILYPGFTRAKVALRNMTPKEIVLEAKTCVAKMATANVVPYTC